MGAGPTNRQISVAPLDLDTKDLARRACAAQGCICGAALVIKLKPIEQLPGIPAAKTTEAEITHLPSCPLVTAMRTN